MSRRGRMHRRAFPAAVAALAAAALPLLALAEPPRSAPDAAPPADVTPPAPPPATAPPAPREPEPPQAAPAPPQPAAPAASGQWVYTQQYGWVWMTYDDAHVYLPPGGAGEPLEYVYYPSYGWAWVVAPWVWGIGPWPYFGPRPPARIVWYRHGWWRTPARWHYRPVPAHAGFGPRGIRPAPARGHRDRRR